MENESCVEGICLDIFSSIIRSICHELKNNLAIINESSGLLDDLAVMHGEEGSVSGKRVRKSVATIFEQVVSADKILKNASLFAHSHEFSISSAWLKQTLSLAVALDGKKARGKSLNVSVDCDETLEFRTYLMVFEAFFYKLLDNIYEKLTDGEAVRIEATKDGNSIEIRIASGEDLQLLIPGYTAGPDLFMINRLKAGLELHASHLLLTIPVDISNTLDVKTSKMFK